MTDSVCFIASFPVPTGLSAQCISTDLDHAHAACGLVIWRVSRAYCCGELDERVGERLFVRAFTRPVNAQRSPSINTSLDADVDFLERIAKEGEVGREMAPGAPPPPSAHPSRRARV